MVSISQTTKDSFKWSLYLVSFVFTLIGFAGLAWYNTAAYTLGWEIITFLGVIIFIIALWVSYPKRFSLSG